MGSSMLSKAALCGNSIHTFWLEFQLDKHPEFWLEIAYTKKNFKNGLFRHVTNSKLNLKPFFKPIFKPKCFLFNCHPVPRLQNAVKVPDPQALEQPVLPAEMRSIIRRSRSRGFQTSLSQGILIHAVFFIRDVGFF